MPIVLRPATVGDIAAMHAIRMAVTENRLVSTVLTHDDYVRALAEPSRTWVVEADDVIVAFAAADASTGNVWALFVDPRHERRGYGRRLHDVMLEWLWSNGVERAWLTTGAGTRAERFYRAAGWTAAGATADGEMRFEMVRPDRRDAAGGGEGS